MSSIQTLDCRGQQCPAPILATARAIKQFGTQGGTLEILANDDAFPMDLRSWARSSGAAVLELVATTDGHRAIIRVGEPGAEATPTNEHRLDCRGMECPQPILEVARAARAHPGALLTVLADDDAFEMDIQSWCRTSKAALQSLRRDGTDFEARVQLLQVAAAPPVPKPPEVPRLQAMPRAATSERPVHRPDAMQQRSAPRSAAPGSRDDVRLDLRGVPEEEWEHELDHAAATPRATRLVVEAMGPEATTRLIQWCGRSGHPLSTLNGTAPVVAEFTIVPSSEARPLFASPGSALAVVGSTDLVVAERKKATILVLHNDKEALLAALLVANGAAAQGMDVMVYFTFWGLNLLRGDLPNPAHQPEKVTWAQRLFKWLMPRGPKRQGLGKLNFGGMGGGMMKSLMKKKNIMDLPELLEAAQEQEVRFVACTMSMSVMGVTKRDLHPYPTLEYGGVAAFVESAGSSEMSLVF